MHKLLFICSFILLLTACKPKVVTLTPPKASFTVVNDSCVAPCVVTFQNTSTGDNITTNAWDFGDGATESSQNPIHNFTNSGIFYTKLLITNSEGKQSDITKPVVIQSAPPLPPTQCRISKISINQFPPFNTDGVSTWAWDEAGGIVSSCDLYITLHDNVGLQYMIANVYNDVSANNLPLLWIDGASHFVNTFVNITDFNQTYRLRLWDKDGSSSEIAHDFNIKPADYYPTNNQAGETQFSIHAITALNEAIDGTVFLQWF